MSPFTPTDEKLFFTKRDPLDPRLGELAGRKVADHDVVILGYPDDEGVHLNGGRVGAALGPAEIRNWLYRMTPHPARKIQSFADAGNLVSKQQIEHRHQAAIKKATDLLKHHKILSLGGGNDYAYCDGLAFLETHDNGIIINVDAHLDVRDLSNGPTSGTPFFRLLESKHKFDFLELGIQTQCNSKNHWQYVEKKNGQIITAEELSESPLSFLDYTLQATGDLFLKTRPVFLAIDIDAFAWPYAAGASQSWPLGILPHDFMPFLNFLLKRMDVRGLGIYEVAPPLDTGHGTAKLAAQLAHNFLHYV